MFSIAFVCTGNRCRSATAEGLTRSIAGRRGIPLSVTSGGTMRSTGQPVPEGTLRAAARFGVDLSQHRSQHLSACSLEEMDLVIGFERDHVAAAVVEGGAATEKSFQFLELLRALEGISEAERGGTDPRTLVARADDLRKAHGFVPNEEIADPIGAPANVHLALADRLEGLIGKLLSMLFANRDPRPVSHETT